MSGAEHAITQGTIYIGSVRETAKGWLAINSGDRRLGCFANRTDAVKAVYEAHKAKGAASATPNKPAGRAA